MNNNDLIRSPGLHLNTSIGLGLGVLKLCSLFSLLRKFLFLKKYFFCSLNHFHIWQVSQQLSCGDHKSNMKPCFDNGDDRENSWMEEIGLPLIALGSEKLYGINNISSLKLPEGKLKDYQIY